MIMSATGHAAEVIVMRTRARSAATCTEYTRPSETMPSAISGSITRCRAPVTRSFSAASPE
jgi:hypothetical protein